MSTACGVSLVFARSQGKAGLVLLATGFLVIDVKATVRVQVLPEEALLPGNRALELFRTLAAGLYGVPQCLR